MYIEALKLDARRPSWRRMLRPWISVPHAFQHLRPSTLNIRQNLHLAASNTAQVQERTLILSSHDDEGLPISLTTVYYGPTCACRRSIRDPDSWNWTSSQVRDGLSTSSFINSHGDLDSTLSRYLVPQPTSVARKYHSIAGNEKAFQ